MEVVGKTVSPPLSHLLLTKVIDVRAEITGTQVTCVDEGEGCEFGCSAAPDEQLGFNLFAATGDLINVLIDWGDGSYSRLLLTAGELARLDKSYPNVGAYTVTIHIRFFIKIIIKKLKN